MAGQKKGFSAIWSAVVERNEHDKVSYLRNIPLFEDLSRRELQLLAEIIHERQFSKGEYVFQQGTPGAAMYIIHSGEVEIFSEQQGKDELLFATLGPGSFFGELALLDDSARSASARVCSPTTIYAFFREEFLRYLEADPVVGTKVYRALAIIIGVRLRKTNEQISQS